LYKTITLYLVLGVKTFKKNTLVSQIFKYDGRVFIRNGATDWMRKWFQIVKRRV